MASRWRGQLAIVGTLILIGTASTYKKTLAEEITKMTATAVKRKLRLKERSQKRKSKKGGKGQNAEEEEDAVS